VRRRAAAPPRRCVRRGPAGRVCACVPPETGAEAHAARERRRLVAGAVVRELRATAFDLLGGRKTAGDLNQWWAAHAPDALEDDIATRRVSFVVSRKAQSCHDRSAPPSLGAWLTCLRE
jgi:hypothetical protein